MRIRNVLHLIWDAKCNEAPKRQRFGLALTFKYHLRKHSFAPFEPYRCQYTALGPS